MDGSGDVDTWFGIYSDFLETYVPKEKVVHEPIVEVETPLNRNKKRKCHTLKKKSTKQLSRILKK